MCITYIEYVCSNYTSIYVCSNYTSITLNNEKLGVDARRLTLTNIRVVSINQGIEYFANMLLVNISL